MELNPGQLIGNYRVVRRLGQGGMGTVCEVEHVGLRRRMALKVFAVEGSKRDFLRKRFLAEGRILARLDHPRLVRVFDLAIDAETDVPYFAMDLVLDPSGEPCTLERWRTDGRADEAGVAAVYADLREGLSYLHRRGVVHRDVKLENVLVDANGHVVLSDFGVSRIFDEGLRKELSVTTTFASDRAPIMGSFGYLAPELKAGAPATPASDAYALGVLVFRLLTGVWYENGSAVMDLLAGFDERWTALLGQLLAEDPSRRLPLPELARGRFAPVGEAASRRLGRKSWPRRLGVAIAALAGLFAVSLAAWLYLESRPRHYDFDEFFPPEEEVSR